MHCVQALWGPVAAEIVTTALALDTADEACFSGAQDGSIVCWKQRHGRPAASHSKLEPVVLLQQHTHPVVAVLPGLQEPANVDSEQQDSSSSRSRYLLSVDSDGWVCLWNSSSWACLDMQRVAPLPPGAKPTLLLMPDQEHVCITIPAMRHQQQQQQQQQQTILQAAAAGFAPMMLVLRWRTLALVAAPLVAPLGLVALTTCSSVISSSTEPKNNSSSSSSSCDADAIVAALALDTAPALSPAAADTIVLAVTQSGVMFAGSLSGHTRHKVWQRPLAAGGSTAPLQQACLCSTCNSNKQSNGSSSAAGLQLQLLIVQHNSWRLLICNTFNSSTGMPESWQQIAAQQYQPAFGQLSSSRALSPFVPSCTGQGPIGVNTRRVSGVAEITNNRVRFSPSAGSESSGAESAYSSDGSETCCSSDSNSSSTASKRDGAAGSQQVSAQSEDDSNNAVTAEHSNVAEAESGGRKRVRRKCTDQQHVVHLLGGAVLKRSPTGSSSSGSSEEAPPNVFVAVWNSAGLQELWSVMLQHAGCSNNSGSEFLYHHQQQQQQQQQREQCILVQAMHLHPWPLVDAQQNRSTSPRQCVEVFAAVTAQHTAYSVMAQHCFPFALQQQQQQQLQEQQVSGLVLLQQQCQLVQGSRAAADWHMHMCELRPHQQHHHHYGLALSSHMQQQQHHHHQQQQQQLLHRCHLHHTHGSWKAAWSRRHLYADSSSSSGPPTNLAPAAGADIHTAVETTRQAATTSSAGGAEMEQKQQQLGSSLAADLTEHGYMVAAAPSGTRGTFSSSSYLLSAWPPAPTNAKQQQQQHSPCAGLPGGSSTGCCAHSSSRKRPASDAAAAAATGHSASAAVCGGPKHARTAWHGSGARQQQAIAAAAVQDMQQQKVTSMLLVSSDCPGLYQAVVILASGSVLFYDLATYCVPGAAWHPSSCKVGTGHVGEITTTLELLFRCPPQDLIQCTGAAAAAAGAGAADGVAHSSSSTSPTVQAHQQQSPLSRSSSNAGWSNFGQTPGASKSSSPTAPQPPQHMEHTPLQQQQQHALNGFAGWSSRPVRGGSVPLLLTGGADGSLRAWDLRAAQLGQTWMAAHPHTAAVQSIVLPPVSARLPWSTCVLSVAADGVVAMTCLATGSTHRRLIGWQHGMPSQIAWSTSRGLVAAGGWAAAKQWHVTVWDAYSGQLDRQLSGSAAHMLIAALSQELTSNLTHLHRAQKQQQQQQPGGSSSSSRPSFDTAAGYVQGLDAGAAAISSATAAAAGHTAAAPCAFTPRMQLADHSSGPIRLLASSRRDMLLLDIDLQQLLQALEAHTKQQQLRSSKRRQQQQGRQQLAGRPSSSSIDGGHSGISTPLSISRPASLDLGVTASGMESATPAAAAAASGLYISAGTGAAAPTELPAAAAAAGVSSSAAVTPTLSRQGSGSSSYSMVSQAAAAEACWGSKMQGRQGGSSSSNNIAPDQQQQCCALALHRRRHLAPAVALALQALCILHRWGLDRQLDEQIVAMLLETGLGAALPALQQQQQQVTSPRQQGPLSSRAGVDLANVAAAAATEYDGSGSSKHSRPLSPAGYVAPAEAVLSSSAIDSTARMSCRPVGGDQGALQADDASIQQQQQDVAQQCSNVHNHPADHNLQHNAAHSSSSSSTDWQPKERLLARQLQMLLQDPNCSGGPALLHSSPCFSQEVLVSGNGAVALALPAARQTGTANHMQVADTAAMSGVLLRVAPTLLSVRLLGMVSVSKWVMATVTTKTACNACSGLVTLYALHLPDLLCKASAAGTVATAATAEGSAVRSAVGANHTAAVAAVRSPVAVSKAATHNCTVAKAAAAAVPSGAGLVDLLLISSTSLAASGLLADAAQLLLAALLHPAAPGTFPVPTIALRTQQQPAQQLELALQQQRQQVQAYPMQDSAAGVVQLQGQQQQQRHAVFVSGSAAAASCWPPVVLQLPLLRAWDQQHAAAAAAAQPQHHQQALSLQQLPDWLPLLVLSAAAAVSHPEEVPAELLAAVAAGLLDVLLGAAPGQASAVAAGWLCQLLRGGQWHIWRPYIGKPAYLLQRLWFLMERLQQSSHAAMLHSPLTTHSGSSSSGSVTPSAMGAEARGTAAACNSSSSSSSNDSSAGCMPLLAEQPSAIADPALVLSSASSMQQQQQQHVTHIEGGLFVASELLPARSGSPATAAGSPVQHISSAGSSVRGSPVQQHQQSPIRPAGLIYAGSSGGGSRNAAFALSHTGRSSSPSCQRSAQAASRSDALSNTVTGVLYSYSGIGGSIAPAAATAAQGRTSSGSFDSPQSCTTHRPSYTSDAVIGSSTGSSRSSSVQAHFPGRHAHSAASAMVRVVPAVGRVGRGALAAWLRSVLDVLAAVTLVDPEAVLNELSHKLADPAADSSSGLPLVMSGIARLLQQQRDRQVLLPYLGYTAALAVQALDPNRPALRAMMYHPVTALVRELTTGFSQVACHSNTLQLAVGSARALGMKPKDISGGGSNMLRWSGFDPVTIGCGSSAGRGARVLLSGELFQATGVAVFDMNGGTKKKVLLLPVLLETQQQQQVAAAGVHKGSSAVSLASSYGSLVNGSTGSDAQGLSEVDYLQQKLPGGIAGLWSAAEGYADVAQDDGAAADASSSSSTSLTNLAAAADLHLQQQQHCTVGWSGSSSEGVVSGSSYSSSSVRAGLTSSSTLTRAEAAMVQHWFGSGNSSGSTTCTAQNGPVSSIGADTALGNHTANVTAGHTIGSCTARLGPGSQAIRPEGPDSTVVSGWGVWQLHANRGSHYPSTSGAQLPIMTADDVATGVSAVAFNPAGDAVVVFIEGCHCCVVWKLAANWTQRLTSLGSSKPSTHQPHAYIAVPSAQGLLHASGAQGAMQQQTGFGGRSHHHHQPQQEHALQSGPAGGVEANRWQLKWQSEWLIDLLYQGRPCATVEVML